ncbi:MAG: thiamine phosphate synthase, partial [Gammaproteobacteria bacterium]
MKHQPLKLTLVTNKLNQPVDDYLNFISRCADAGITAVQLREKHLTKNKLLSFASDLKKLHDTFQIPLIINDNLELCLTLNADGLHLGQNDGDITIARNLLGP